MIARTIENHINSEFARAMRNGHAIMVFNYSTIAYSTGIDKATVSKMLFPLGCGSEGITVTSPDYEPPSY